MAAVTEALVCSRVDGPYEVRQVVLGEMREDELLVRIVASGICHTDFACTNGTTPIRLPLVGGHEGAGVVERVGSQVGHVEVGDEVLLTFSTCGECASCRRGIPAYCFNMWEMNFLGARRDGTRAFSTLEEDGKPISVSSHFFGQSSFARRTIVRGVSAVKVEKGLPLHLLCSMGCGMQTGAGTVLNALRVQMGQSLVVFGAGAVGMAGIMAARLTSAAIIVAVDVVDAKLVKAREMGATHTINPTKEGVDVVGQIRTLTKGFGADRAMDTTGNVNVIKSMMECAAPGGIVATVGAPRKGATVEIEPAAWLARGVSYVGVHQGSSVPMQFIPYLVQLWKDGRFPVDRLVQTFHYTEIQKATEALHSGACVKAVLLWEDL